MLNTTSIKIPKKYAIGLIEVEKDCDGYWGYANDDYKFAATDSHTIHGMTQKEFLSDLRTMYKVTLDN